MQAECGIDIASDGEYSKTGFSQYITDRLSGSSCAPTCPARGGGTARAETERGSRRLSRDRGQRAERPDSPGRPQSQMISTVCTGPVTYRGQAAVQTDIATSSRRWRPERRGGVHSGRRPGTIELQRANHFYKTEEEFLYAIANAMKTEYQAIVDAGSSSRSTTARW